MKFIALATLWLSMTLNLEAGYSVTTETVEGYRVEVMRDSDAKVEARICPSFGNNLYSLKFHGQEVMWSPTGSLKELHEKKPLMGNPFLAPWANRLDRDGFFANGKFYRFNISLRNIRPDANGNPIHGLLMYSDAWKVTKAAADNAGVSVTSTLEFWKYPDLMAQFPFAHDIEMTYRLQNGVITVTTKLINHSREAMPVSIAFHPYFQLTDASRDDWQLEVPAKKAVVLNKLLMPTGEFREAQLAHPQSLAGKQFDDVFIDLGTQPKFVLLGRKQRLTVTFDKNYPVGIVYSPATGKFVCVEPMTGLTNAFNLAHAGVVSDVPSVAAGQSWEAVFSISAEGFRP
jgi:aldose 1-epimerase